MYRPFLLLLVLFFSTGAAYAAACREPKLEHLPEVHIGCLYYKGTRLYRSKEYAAARLEWQKIVNMSGIPKEVEYLKVDASNNLGFLYYMGLGVEKDRQRAIREYWIPAEKQGHEEAAYHLCHAYAETEPKSALGYCREALRRYEKTKDQDDENAEVIAQLKKLVTSLERR